MCRGVVAMLSITYLGYHYGTSSGLSREMTRWLEFEITLVPRLLSAAAFFVIRSPHMLCVSHEDADIDQALP